MKQTFDSIDRRLTALSKLNPKQGVNLVNLVNSKLSYLFIYIYKLTALATVTALFVKRRLGY